MMRQTQRPYSQIRLLVLTGLALLALLLAAGLAVAAPDSPTRMSLAQKSTPTPAAPPPPQATAETGTVSGGAFGGLPLGNNAGGVNLGNNPTGGQTSGTPNGTSGLDFTLTPTFGSVELVSGFSNDPYTADIVAGGNVDAFAALGNPCLGFVATAPDYRLLYTAGQYNLRLFFTGESDTTLVISAPDGSWYCDDDSGGSLNPLLDFNTPLNGQYDIWVGSYQAGQLVNGTLTITEMDIMPEGSTATNTNTIDTGNVQIMGANINEPWTNAPVITAGMVVGNTIDNTDWGWAYAFDAQAGQTVTVRMEATADSSLDCYLGVVDGNQTVVAEDDDSGGGYNSQIVYTFPQAGRYYIVATRYSTDTGTSAGAFVMSLVEGAAAGSDDWHRHHDDRHCHAGLQPDADLWRRRAGVRLPGRSLHGQHHRRGQRGRGRRAGQPVHRVRRQRAGLPPAVHVRAVQPADVLHRRERHDAGGQCPGWDLVLRRRLRGQPASAARLQQPARRPVRHLGRQLHVRSVRRGRADHHRDGHHAQRQHRQGRLQPVRELEVSAITHAFR